MFSRCVVFNNRGVSGEVLLVRLISVCSELQSVRESVRESVRSWCVLCTCFGAHGESGMQITQKCCPTAGIKLLILYFNAESENSDLTVHKLSSHLA